MNIFNKYKSWINSGIYSGLQKFVILFFGIASTMLLAHKGINPVELGIWSLFLIITSFVEIIRHGLVKNSLIKFLNSSDKNSNNEILSSAFLLNLLITGIISLVLLLTIGQLSVLLNAPALVEMIYLFQIGLVFLIPFSHYEWIMIARSNFKGIFLSYLVRQGITLSLILFFIIFKINITLNLLVVFFVSGIFAGSLVNIILNRFTIKTAPKLSLNWIKQLFNYGKYSFGTGISNMIFRNSDQFLLSSIILPPPFALFTVALYGISIRIFNLADMPSQVIGDIVFSRSTSIESKDKIQIKSYYEKSVGAILVFIIPAIIIIELFTKKIILIIAGSEYISAEYFLKTIILSSFFLAFIKQFGTLLDSQGTPKLNFIFTTIIAIVNIITGYVFISHFGLIGAAISFSITIFITFLIVLGILFKFYKISFFNCIKNTIFYYQEIFYSLNKLKPKYVK